MNTLRQGKVGVVSLSSPTIGERKGKIEAALRYLAESGVEVCVGNTVFSEESYKSASREARANELMSFFTDSEISLILNSTGGFSSNEILDLLDYDVIRRNPKWFVGYSDITAVNLALFSQAGLSTINGAMLVDFVDDPECFNVLESLLSGRTAQFENPGYIWESGGNSRRDAGRIQMLAGKVTTAEGFLVAGNLSTFNLLLGTPFFPDLEGAVLFLEYDKEEANSLPSIERLLWQLRLAGCFDRIQGLVFGAPEQVVKEEEGTWQRQISSILSEVFEPYKFPILFNAAFGHIYPSSSFANGQPVFLSNSSIALGQPTLSCSRK